MSDDVAATSKIIELERGNVAEFRALTMQERSRLLAAACRDAAAIENSRRAMGFPAAQPAPWPESTWKFLAEAMRRVRSG